MKKLCLSLIIALVAMATAKAQQIAVVSENGETTMYQTLANAVSGASSGSTIYLPGGGFNIGGLAINKKVTIIGVGHKPNSKNPDGNTTLSGNLFFMSGSQGCALMGCYVAGTVYVGYSASATTSTTNNILIRYCNVGGVRVSSLCHGIIFNQNYIRGTADCNYTDVTFTNNVMHSIFCLKGGIVSNNVILGSYNSYPLNNVDNTTIANNVIGYCDKDRGPGGSTNCAISGNMYQGDFGDDCIDMSDVKWEDVFEDYNDGKISPSSNFHFTEKYQEYENECGIYAGSTKFKDDGMAPVPYIVAKSIPEQTDATGKLTIKVRVKAGE